MAELKSANLYLIQPDVCLITSLGPRSFLRLKKSPLASLVLVDRPRAL